MKNKLQITVRTDVQEKKFTCLKLAEVYINEQIAKGKHYRIFAKYAPSAVPRGGSE